MIVVLRYILRKFITRGSLTVELPDGLCLTAGNGVGSPLKVRLTDRRAVRELLLRPEMAVGELFTDGRLQVSGCSIYDILALLCCNLKDAIPPVIGHAQRTVRSFLGRFKPRNSEWLAKSNVHRHYDIDDRIYSMFLDSDRQYSCAYFEHQSETLEEAQLAKKRHIVAKLLVPPGASVLDIGSGWGGLAFYLSQMSGADVTGLTLSSEQLKVSKNRANGKGLSAQVHFRLQDYRTINDRFDRVVSVGMFEHVGPRDYGTFFQVMTRSLKSNGIALLHFIGRLDGKGPMNPWFVKYIFPGSYLPALSEVMPAIEESGLVTTDIEILRLHYADTLAAWRSRFLIHRSDAAAILGERFCRMWEFYLASAETGFRYGGLAVFQIQLAKQIAQVPRTRAYIEYEEERLRQLERATVARPLAAE
ncbi:MAG TPA: cyclopropane-fatty-acyl-phospholipid synthase family protein [Hyphomicrobium sp.]|nr:cyclopropane-fatty-acyl-phospholipid synthase family protein [Hyphomicrobium sp.]